MTETSIQSVLIIGTRRLVEAGIENAAIDARILMAHALDVARDRLTLVLPDPISPAGQEAFERAIEARLKRQPVAQIIGQRAFFGREFIVTGDVLDPRPETELLVATALEAPFENILDLGVGSGCILLSLLAENESARGVGVDVSAAAIAVAQENAVRFGVQDRCRFMQSDWWSEVSGTYDLIVSNPPYISEQEMQELSRDVHEWEPHGALSPGGDGLSPYQTIARSIFGYLKPGGRLIVEIGPTQGQAVSGFFRAAGLHDIRILPDLDGRDRVVIAFMPR